MTGILMAWGWGYMAARFGKNIWTMIATAVLGGAVVSLIIAGIAYAMNPGALAIDVLLLRALKGSLWYALTAIISSLLFLRRFRKLAAKMAAKEQAQALSRERSPEV